VRGRLLAVYRRLSAIETGRRDPDRDPPGADGTDDCQGSALKGSSVAQSHGCHIPEVARIEPDQLTGARNLCRYLPAVGDYPPPLRIHYADLKVCHVAAITVQHESVSSNLQPLRRTCSG
jgi:hypothetical protein